MAAPAKNVLVVDDAPEFLSFMEMFLSAEGYAVRTAATPDEAERALTGRQPDLVIADVRMPGLPPFAVLDRLDRDPATRDLPVLLCTASSHDLEVEVERLARPHTEALLKPFDIDDLQACVERLLAGGERQPDHSPAPNDPN